MDLDGLCKGSRIRELSLIAAGLQAHCPIGFVICTYKPVIGEVILDARSTYITTIITTCPSSMEHLRVKDCDYAHDLALQKDARSWNILFNLLLGPNRNPDA